MRLNADFSRKVVVYPSDYQWVPSPTSGVERMMLDRIGDEVARATSIVRYAPDSDFPPHRHDGGEEILVLAGEFADEHGCYPAGTYLRNPVGTSHRPKVGDKGAVIFVKRHQFAEDDRRQVVLNTDSAPWKQGRQKGETMVMLHDFESEQVALIRWEPQSGGTAYDYPGGGEILVLEGTLYDESDIYPAGSWIRFPPSAHHLPYAGEEGALIYLKKGHLNKC
ncbi:cupin domain-containing protein [Hahella ganghwensis]|uniref:cupin domain-containing protein n=1 Tax=Hahella ganghwensis TaxID=286420 RepID=UPI0003684F99|nr:cupin domain-containing protein [Hahella ganghwensis]